MDWEVKNKVVFLLSVRSGPEEAAVWLPVAVCGVHTTPALLVRERSGLPSLPRCLSCIVWLFPTGWGHAATLLLLYVPPGGSVGVFACFPAFMSLWTEPSAL